MVDLREWGAKGEPGFLACHVNDRRIASPAFRRREGRNGTAGQFSHAGTARCRGHPSDEFFLGIQGDFSWCRHQFFHLFDNRISRNSRLSRALCPWILQATVNNSQNQIFFQNPIAFSFFLVYNPSYKDS